MVKGRRARKVGGSPHGDRPKRRGASVTGVCHCASRACCMRCTASTPCTDRSSSEQWLERSSRPDLQPGCIPSQALCVDSMQCRGHHEIPSIDMLTDTA